MTGVRVSNRRIYGFRPSGFGVYSGPVYSDPQDGSVTRTMYSNNIPTICATVNPDGTAVWKGLTFPLIER